MTALSHKERWIWIDLLCYCAAYSTNGFLPANISELVPGATAKFLNGCAELQLLDVVGTDLRVHDWDQFAPKDPTGAERQAAWRRRKVLQNEEIVTGHVTDGFVTEPSTSRVGARARSRPVPSCPKDPSDALTPQDADEEHQIREIVERSLGSAA